MGGVHASIGVLDHDDLLGLEARIHLLQSFQSLEKGFRVGLALLDIGGGDDGGKSLPQLQLIQDEFDFLPGRAGGDRHSDRGSKAVDEGNRRWDGGSLFSDGQKIMSRFHLNKPFKVLGRPGSIPILQEVNKEVVIIVGKVFFTILFPVQIEPFFLHGLLEGAEVNRFVIHQDSIEVKNNGSDLHEKDRLYHGLTSSNGPAEIAVMPEKILQQKILEQHSAVREAVGFLDLTERGKIEMTGPDRITFLHAMISNDVVELSELAGRYGTLLTDRGKMVADFFYHKLPETVLIDVSHDLLSGMKESLEKYIVMDEVELEDISARTAHFSLQGPKSPDLVEKLFGKAIPGQPYEVREVDWEGNPVWLIAKPELADSGCELILSRATADGLKKAILEKGSSLGVIEISGEGHNILRLEAGIPWYGRDMDESRYPMEARLETAISLTKGCYLGQEVVSKATHIGGVSNLLMGLKLDGSAVPAKNAGILSDDGTRIGAITSAVLSPRFECPIALGYLKSKFALPGEFCQVEVTPGETTRAEIVEKFV